MAPSEATSSKMPTYRKSLNWRYSIVDSNNRLLEPAQPRPPQILQVHDMRNKIPDLSHTTNANAERNRHTGQVLGDYVRNKTTKLSKPLTSERNSRRKTGNKRQCRPADAESCEWAWVLLQSPHHPILSNSEFGVKFRMEKERAFLLRFLTDTS